MVLQWALFMPGFADYKNMNHLRVKSKKKKAQGELAQAQWVSLHMQGESLPLRPCTPCPNPTQEFPDYNFYFNFFLAHIAQEFPDYKFSFNFFLTSFF